MKACEVCEAVPAAYSFDAILEEDDLINILVCRDCGQALINGAEPDFWSFESLY